MVMVCYGPAQAQTGSISGRVVDAGSGEALPFANVYISNTTLGTTSGVDGFFELKNVPFGAVQLVVSFVGYVPQMLEFDFQETAHLSNEIRLEVSEAQLLEVEVAGKRDKRWERQFSRFEKVFLGETRFAAQCKIQNPWVLNFEEDREVGLTAVADVPVEIDNMALGYKVFYDLRIFTANASSFFFSGSSRFVEMEPTSDAQATKWRANRNEAYRGSPRHLFQSILLNNILQGTLLKEGFRLYKDKAGYEGQNIRRARFADVNGTLVEPLPLAELVGASYRGGLYRISLPARVEVHYESRLGYPINVVYSDVPYEVSWIEVRDGFIDVTKEGINQRADRLVVAGAMSLGRVAYMLPYDYQPEREDP